MELFYTITHHYSYFLPTNVLLNTLSPILCSFLYIQNASLFTIEILYFIQITFLQEHFGKQSDLIPIHTNAFLQSACNALSLIFLKSDILRQFVFLTIALTLGIHDIQYFYVSARAHFFQSNTIFMLRVNKQNDDQDIFKATELFKYIPFSISSLITQGVL